MRRLLIVVLLGQCHLASKFTVLIGTFPMCEQYLEPSLFFSLERLLVTVKFLENLLIAGIVVRHLNIVPDDPDTVISPPIFSAMIRWCFSCYLQGISKLYLFFEEGVVVLLEQTD